MPKALFLILIFILKTQAAILEPSLNSAVPFFKSPDSLFPSGQSRREDLINSLMSSSSNLDFRVRWNDQIHFVPHDQILREIELAQKVKVRKKTPLNLLAELTSPVVQELKAGQNCDVLSLRGPWARVRLENSQKVGYVLISELDPQMDDLATYTNLVDVSLKAQPEINARNQVVLAPKTRIQLLQLKGDWGLFKTQSQQGWLPMSEVIGRADFADAGWDSTEKKWHNLSYRSGSSMWTRGHLYKIPLSRFTAFRGHRSLAILQAKHATLPKGARLEILQAVAQRWNLSRVKGHGEVWWKSSLSSQTENLETVLTKEILKKNLAAMSFDSKSKKGLASASGIYRTRDGKKWTKISFFAHDNWPVCIHPSGAWFVGPFISTDEGETFQPAIKWSDVVKKIQKVFPNRKLPHFRVVDIKTINADVVEMKIDTGIKTARLRSRALSQDWTPVELTEN